MTAPVRFEMQGDGLNHIAYGTYRLGQPDRLRRLEAALAEIVRREARSEYKSLASAPGEFAQIAKDALRDSQRG